ncbi:MAG: zf-HC2 domain-containing protein [Armatimonadota bacterium]|nr:zf-HC2 domain-containing protein [Armatimonadota bacterium]MDW8142272.1 zf-HC2 domain-containing protein [Armatimonadota bacterium]
MSCDWARRLMVLADSLTKEEKVELEEHLSQCPSCASEWQKWQKLFSLLSNLPSISSTHEERTQLMNSLKHVPKVPDLDCQTARSFIWRWIDNDLSAQEQASLIVHLANCDKCQAALWQAEQTVHMLRSLPKLKATAAEKEALKARLRQMSKRPTLVPFVWRVALPVAAAAALALAVIAKWQPSTHEQALTVRRETAAPSIARTQPTAPKLTEPRVAERIERPKPVVRRPQVLAQTQPLAKPERIQTVTKRQTQLVKFQEQLQTKQMTIPKTSEPLTVVQTAPETEPKTTVSETVVVESPRITEPMSLTVPVPSTISAAAAVGVTPSPQLTPQLVQESPVTTTPVSEPRQLVVLPPITSTSENDLSLQPPRVHLTVVPPSQRLYQKSGVALVTVPPEKRPVKVSEEKALAPDLSIPLAAERYRSHTATIPFFRFGISW